MGGHHHTSSEDLCTDIFISRVFRVEYNISDENDRTHTHTHVSMSACQHQRLHDVTCGVDVNVACRMSLESCGKPWRHKLSNRPTIHYKGFLGNPIHPHIDIA